MLISDKELLTVFGSIGTGLVAAISYLFKKVLDNNERVSKLSERVGKAEGRQEGVEKMSADTLKVVHKAIVERANIKT